ncbi:MAG: carboxypeptidase regulatory-like domain-containing protein [Planctomycetota bacterium]
MINVGKVARCCLSVAALMLLVWTAGCGGNDNLGGVYGTVTMDGEPLADALVTFAPLEPGRPAAGRTDEQGRYELVFSRDAEGALIGEHLVSISTYNVVPGEGDTEKVIPESVPAKYNVNSQRKVTVEAGSNEFNFDLDSEGEVIEPQN